jgi:hypothetical protein
VAIALPFLTALAVNAFIGVLLVIGGGAAGSTRVQAASDGGQDRARPNSGRTIFDRWADTAGASVRCGALSNSLPGRVLHGLGDIPDHRRSRDAWVVSLGLGAVWRSSLRHTGYVDLGSLAEFRDLGTWPDSGHRPAVYGLGHSPVRTRIARVPRDCRRPAGGAALACLTSKA